MISASSASVPSLFDRLPMDLFRPLAAPNRLYFWRLLVHLHSFCFGPDAPPPPEDGIPARQLAAELDRFLLTQGEWADDEAPSGASGAAYIRRLVEAGWLHEETVGVRTFVGMRPAVQQFLGLLAEFAEKGPEYLSGKAQLIFSQLKAVQADPQGQAPGFHEAAKGARAILSTLASTSIRVREIMERLSLEDSTASYVASFFRDYISAVYIGDYQALRTAKHPLRHRLDILRIVAELRDDADARKAIVSGYRKHLNAGSREDAERLFDRDVQRFQSLERVEAYLDRLDETITRANRRAVGYLQYMLKTRGGIDKLVGRAITGAVRADAESGMVDTLFAPGTLLNAECLREPRRLRAAQPRSRIRVRELTAEEKALNSLRQIMRRNRDANPSKVIEFLVAHAAHERAVSSDQLRVSTISDMCVYFTLMRAAQRATTLPAAAHRNDPLLNALRRFRFVLVGGERTLSTLFSSARFHVSPAMLRSA